MTKDEALRKALEALENASNNSAAWNQKLEAITAIKEALAQPEQDWIERERAVGYREGHQNALKQMAQPEQEPVACPKCKEWEAVCDQHLRHIKKLKKQRKPLTDGEFGYVWRQETGRIMGTDRALLLRAKQITEAAHGIKGDA